LALLILCVSLVLCAASCGGTTPSANNTTEAAAETTKAAVTTTAAAAEETAGESVAAGPAWAADISPVTLSMYVAEGWWSKVWDPEKEVCKKITDTTGVTLDIWTSSGDAWDKLNAMIASETLPDIMVMGIWAAQIKQISSLGMAYPLDDLIDKNCPEFNDIIAPQMRKWYTEDDGKWYALAGFGTWAEDITPETKIYTNSGMQVRADICAELGIDMKDFETKRGTLDACKKVKDANYTYNGLQVTPLNIGMSGTSGFGKILDFFAVPQEGKDGKLVDRRFEPGYLEALLWINEAYNEGLFSEENFTFDRMAVAERMTNGSLFLLIDQISDFKSEAMNLTESDPNAFFKPCGPFLNDRGDTPNMTPRALAGWTVAMINSKTPHPDRCINFFYWNYSEEGQMIWSYGIEGKHWEWDPDFPGHVRKTAAWVDTLNEDNEAASKAGFSDFWWFYNIPLLQTRDPKPVTPRDKWSAEIDDYFAKWAYNDLAFNSIVLEGGSDEAAISAEVGTYWENQLPKMMTAPNAAECEKIWRESLEEIKSMGIEDVIAARDAIFQQHKQILGMDFAYPSNMK
jgi:putative aldouronate transport system substrate-binding protein